MWHNLVSFLESTVQLAMFGLVLMGSQHPLATAGISLFFVLTIVMLVTEGIEERRVTSQFGETLPVRIER